MGTNYDRERIGDHFANLVKDTEHAAAYYDRDFQKFMRGVDEREGPWREQFENVTVEGEWIDGKGRCVAACDDQGNAASWTVSWEVGDDEDWRTVPVFYDDEDRTVVAHHDHDPSRERAVVPDVPSIETRMNEAAARHASVRQAAAGIREGAREHDASPGMGHERG